MRSVLDTTDSGSAYRTALHMSEFLDLGATRTYPLLDLDEALVHVGEYLSS